MKVAIINTTLKKSGLSHTQVLAELCAQSFKKENPRTQIKIIRLAKYNVGPGTYINSPRDDWPGIYQQLLTSDVIIIATPIWWGGQSSLAQRVIERLDEVHDQIMQGEVSAFKDKIGGVLITGGSDGGQHIIGNLCNFYTALGMIVPPYAGVVVLSEKLAKSADTPRSKIEKLINETYSDDLKKLASSVTQIHNLLQPK